MDWCQLYPLLCPIHLCRPQPARLYNVSTRVRRRGRRHVPRHHPRRPIPRQLGTQARPDHRRNLDGHLPLCRGGPHWPVQGRVGSGAGIRVCECKVGRMGGGRVHLAVRYRFWLFLGSYVCYAFLPYWPVADDTAPGSWSPKSTLLVSVPRASRLAPAPTGSTTLPSP